MGAELSHEDDVGDDVQPEMLNERSVDAVAKYIQDSAKDIVVLTGAGISTAAGIPDFRSPKTGLYANLERLNLPYAEAVFDIAYFRNNPEPFYMLARELYPGKYVPTISHAFITLLSQKGKLRMLFTQNIDCLERVAGIPSDQIIEAHGSFANQRCIECGLEYPEDLMKVAIESGKVPQCSENPRHEKPVQDCDGLVKPDIVFFGESLPAAFHQNLHVPAAADLMLIIGTSLTVYPFAGLPEYARKGIPRVLFNLERVGSIGSRADDVCVLDPCDEGIRKLADALGWTSELENLWAEMGGGKNINSTEAPLSLEDEIDQITKGVDRATISKPSFLEKHLEEKQQKGPPEDIATEIEPSVAKSEAESDGASSSSESSDEKVCNEEVEKKPLSDPVESTSSDAVSLKATSQPPSGSHSTGDNIPQVVDSKEAPQHTSVPSQDEIGLPKSPPKPNI